MKSRETIKIDFTISSFFTIMPTFNKNKIMKNFQEIKELKTSFQETYNLLESFSDNLKWEKVAIAVSWGSDSIFLSFLLLTFYKENNLNPNNIHFLHCNHKVRKESEMEAEYLKEFFKNYHFQLFERQDTKEEKEEILRERRYQQFNEYCKNNWIKYIFFGHNLTDKIETSLMNTIRWCGLKWFYNMETISTQPLLDKSIEVIRPLLAIPKSKIENFCIKNDIKFFEDKTNFDTSTSLRNKLRHEFIIPLSKLWKGNSFFESRNNIYNAINDSQSQNYLMPLKTCPYWNANNAYKRAIPKDMITTESLANILTTLWIWNKKWEINQLLERLKNDWEWYHTLQGRTLFHSHWQIYFIQSDKKFWEKELHLEKLIKNPWIQIFWKYQLDIQKNLIWTTIRFPKSWDHYKDKLLTKRAINQKIPIFWRNILPLAERDGKIIFVFEPSNLIY